MAIEQNMDGADTHIDKLVKKHLGLEKYLLHQPGEQQIILRIKPEKIFHQKPPKR